MRLSVLVPSVSSRYDTFARNIQAQLFEQYERLSEQQKQQVEIIVLTDTKSMMLGDKRNKMLELAQGEYVAFVDDDDRVEPDYIEALLGNCFGVDAVTFAVSVSLDGAPPKPCFYSIKHKRDANLPDRYLRIPNHICAVKRTLALQARFPSKLCGEDSEYAKRLLPLLRTERRIERVLYHYDFNSATTETQRATAPPEVSVDVVVLSKASTERHREMTQRTIDTCRAGAGGHTVNITVIEQVEGTKYTGATVVYDPSPFQFNKFANNGIRLGSAPWVMLANNDLEFMPGWLQPLLDAKHPVVSPINPIDRRQRGILRNTVGDINGRHFSGWCFMMTRELWERIGGFDEDFIFWCCDDAVIEQLRALNIAPMLVPRSRVKHAASQTLREDDGSMTWAQVWKFEQKYGVVKFANDPRYNNWKQREFG